MTELQVRITGAEYTIHIGLGLLDSLADILPAGSRRVLVISDENVAPTYLPRLEAAFGNMPDCLVLPAGESGKTVATLQHIWDELAARRFPRDGLLVALGGGVIGDITGFAAATWMRGTAFLQLPTTLLAQVDASVGGKTAVNLDAGKNLVGAFHQPEAVLIDTATLSTLPDREYAAGLAEVVKAALISGSDFLDWLESAAGDLASRNPSAAEQAILRSCELKAAIVADDERETGRRAVLNLGHTFGHAIETGLGHGEWLHGEAVAAGLMLALSLSEAECGLDPRITGRVKALLEAFGLPVRPPETLPAGKILELMGGDKKADAAGWRLVTVHAPGDVRVERFQDTTPIAATIDLALKAG